MYNTTDWWSVVQQNILSPLGLQSIGINLTAVDINMFARVSNREEEREINGKKKRKENAKFEKATEKKPNILSLFGSQGVDWKQINGYGRQYVFKI